MRSRDLILWLDKPDLIRSKYLFLKCGALDTRASEALFRRRAQALAAGKAKGNSELVSLKNAVLLYWVSGGFSSPCRPIPIASEAG